jgi:accessory gene regulator protein AgrB
MTQMTKNHQMLNSKIPGRQNMQKIITALVVVIILVLLENVQISLCAALGSCLVGQIKNMK